MNHDYPWPMPMVQARAFLGAMWGLERPLTRIEMARALNLSGENGGDYISRMERQDKLPTGSTEVALRMMLAGGKPHTMDNVIKPGYPRGPTR